MKHSALFLAATVAPTSTVADATTKIGLADPTLILRPAMRRAA